MARRGRQGRSGFRKMSQTYETPSQEQQEKGAYSDSEHSEGQIKTLLSKGWEGAEEIVFTLFNFTPLTHKDIAFRLLDAGHGGLVSHHIHFFDERFHSSIVEKICSEGDADAVEEMLYYLGDFEGLSRNDRVDIPKVLVGRGHDMSVAKYVSRFEENNHTEIALNILRGEEEWVVSEYLFDFKNLSVEVLEKLLDFGYLHRVAEYPYSFEDSICAGITEGEEELTFENIKEVGIQDRDLTEEERGVLDKIRDFTRKTTKAYRRVMRLLMMVYQSENHLFTEEIAAKIKSRGYDLPQFSIYDYVTGDTFLATDIGMDTEDTRIYPGNFLLNFNLPRPFGRFWYRGGEGDRSIPVRGGEIEWGDFYRKSMPVIWDMVDDVERYDDLNMWRMNGHGVHDYKKYYYLWEISSDADE